ncbi:TPA: hypothetical protein N0F65_004580 [Lagenidium giganteum]|uniref:Abnormal spindle-like microcephaly-associated protein n=1 Tax=Lagenidium giganteum TaxID=4803 RepID=A0AAV2ZIB0_9STRA|nr:TPA: hypothetical protein N0F65_004580 [Lagenidium giganteum]
MLKDAHSASNSAYGRFKRRRSSKDVAAAALSSASTRSKTRRSGLISANGELVCSLVRHALEQALAPTFVQVVDINCACAQRALLGAKRYWYRHVTQDKITKCWTASFYEVALRKATKELPELRDVQSWAAIPHLPKQDVSLSHLGPFDTEKAATTALDEAVKARDRTNPLPVMGGELPTCLLRFFQITIVSDVFQRLPQPQRLDRVFQVLLDLFENQDTSAKSTGLPLTARYQLRLRGYAYVGPSVARLPQWRALPYHFTVAAKTSTQWRADTNHGHHPLVYSHTERFGLSHLANDRALAVDHSVLPVSRGLAELVTTTEEAIQAQAANSVLPHFYHGLPSDLKRMIADEQLQADARLTHSSQYKKLRQNSEATFLKKYLRRRREVIDAAVKCQRLVRRRAQPNVLRRLHRQQRAAMVIQRIFRGHGARRYARAYFRVMTCAALIVQSVFRSYASRQRTKALRRAMNYGALQLQRLYRGHCDRVLVHWIRQMQASAIVVERLVRGFMARRQTQRRRAARYKRTVVIPAVKNIQRVFRGHRARLRAQRLREERYHRTVLTPAALKIERLLRGFVARKRAKRHRQRTMAARVLQRHWRSYRYRCKWQALMVIRHRHRMAIKIGAAGRGFVVRKFYQRERRRIYHFQVVLPAAVSIQRTYRGYIVRRRLEDLRDRVEAAITLQQMWRQRSKVRVIRERLAGFRDKIRHTSAATIQRAFRCSRARHRLFYLRMAYRARYGRAALAVQSAWKSFSARKQLQELRFCAQIERKAQALTKWKDEREMITFDMTDARDDLKRLMKYKAKSLRRIKELKDMRVEWERRQPVIAKELSELTEEDIDRGWGEAFTTEQQVIHFSLLLSVEDILGRREQIREYEAEIEDVRLELEDLERDLEECMLEESVELEQYRDLEIKHAHSMFTKDRDRRVQHQRIRWRIRDDRKKVVRRERTDLQLLEKDLMAKRQVQELGTLSFEKKLFLQQKLEQAIQTAAQSNTRQREASVEQAREVKLAVGFDDIVSKMRAITTEYTYDMRVPKNDMREHPEGRMCMKCGRVTCDCNSEQPELSNEVQPIAKLANAKGQRLQKSNAKIDKIKRKRQYYNQQNDED